MQMLYKRDTTGKTRTWVIETNYWGQYRTLTGVLDGQLVNSAWTQCEIKNAGRSNETTAYEQAKLEAKAQHTKKLERGYTPDLDAIDSQKFRSPMLAKKYEDVPTTFPCWSQPKLDGIRCIANSEGLWTRTGKPITGAPHIFEALQPFFTKWPTIELDGELYNHELHDDFNEIVSMVRKIKPTTEGLKKSRGVVQYHVYDLPSSADLAFPDRLMLLGQYLLSMLDPMVQLVQTNRVLGQRQLDGLYEGYMAENYEGQMVRSNGVYEFKRSKTLLKRKEFQDAEFEIVRIEEGLGNWAGFAKKVICKLPDGRKFGAGIAGTQVQMKSLLAKADDLVGKEATITFFNLTPDGIPRFGIAKALHQEARI